MNRTGKAIAFWVVLIVAAALVYSLTSSWPPSLRTETFSEFMNHVQGDEVKEVVITGDEIAYVTSENGQFRAILPEGYQGLPNTLLERNVKVSARPASTSVWTSWGPVLMWTSWGPVLLLMAFLLFFYPPSRSGGNGGSPMSFGGVPKGSGTSHDWM